MARKGKKQAPDHGDGRFENAREHVSAHPIFRPLAQSARIYRDDHPRLPPDGWVIVEGSAIIAHPRRVAHPEEWMWVIAHGLLHLGFGHTTPPPGADPVAWNVACDAFVAHFLAELGLGAPPPEVPVEAALESLGRVRDERKLYERLKIEGIPADLAHLGTAGSAARDFYGPTTAHKPPDWPRLLAQGLSAAVTDAIDVAGGRKQRLGGEREWQTPAQAARRWFIHSYPLLGALAAAFTIVEDPSLCQRLAISVAAVDAEAREIYINPAAALDEEELRFVMAHELLHVGLRHQARRQGRDPYLWNVACDYCVNGWLIEMKIGAMPDFGALHDPELRGLSAEAIYDRIVNDIRRIRKLCTLRGVGAGDMLEGPRGAWWAVGEGVALDDFYRRCLVQGMTFHQDGGRGLLPADLVEEIQALYQPPIPWEVKLGRWFDVHFPLEEKLRTYARPSRRQSATPDIPRPRQVVPLERDKSRTFGVVLDTSGSMDRKLLAKALGAISSYAQAREVERVRLVYCDAHPYDEGYVAPERLLADVKVRGRGGTVLQPAIDLLQKAADFPEDGPLLIITDGMTDRLRVRRTHAFLMPPGARLPFAPRGEIFWIE